MNSTTKSTRSGWRMPALAAGATLAAALLLSANDGQAIEAASSLNPVGSGARAVGMGGAFIGIADDATAASWNPAGLVQLEKPEFSIAYGYFNRQQSFSSAAHPEAATGDQGMDADGINYASFVYPFTAFDKNMVVSVNYQRLIDMNKEYNIPAFNLGTVPVFGNLLLSNFNYKQEGYLSTITPAFAIQVVPELYLGVAVNFWGDYLGTSSWKTVKTGTVTAGGAPIGGGPFTPLNIDYSVSGSPVNVTTGFLLNLNKFTIGGVFKSPFTMDVDKSGNGANSPQESFDMPMSAGLGLAYRYNDAWTTGLDVYWTEWSSFVSHDSGIEFNPIVGDTTAAVGRSKDTYQVRLGTEYLIMKDKWVFPLRVGVFYDPQPGYHNGVQKVDDYFGFSLGSGVTYKNYSLDVAYQYRTGDKVGAAEVSADGTVESDTTQHTVLTSLIYRF